MINHAITVKDSSGNTTTQIYGNGYSPQQVIKNLVKAWSQTILANKSTEKLDESIQLCSQFETIQEVIDKVVADCRAASDAETFLRDYCGINHDNKDTDAITGWNAGGLSIKTASDIVGETLSSLKHIPDYTNTTFKAGDEINIALTPSASYSGHTSGGKDISINL